MVISCAGASMNLKDLRDRTSFTAVDFLGNRNLLEEAKWAHVSKFIYVSLFGADKLLGTEYASAHERFVDLLRSSELASTIVRPTGFFAFQAAIVEMARKGHGIVVGSGEARTNPVHEADVAEICAAAIQGSAREISIRYRRSGR